MLSHGGMGQEPKTIIPEPKTIVPPVRRSSLRSGQDVHVEPSRPVTLPAGALPPSQPQKREPVLEELAYYRAELVLLERNALKQLGSVRGWSTTLGDLYDQELRRSAPMEDVSLDEDSPPTGNTADAQPVEAVTLAGVEDRVLYDALQSEEAFYQSYGVRCFPFVHLEPDGSHHPLGSLRSSPEAFWSGGQSGTYGGHLGRPRGPEIVRPPRRFIGPP